jgi:hypothetical protein
MMAATVALPQSFTLDSFTKAKTVLDKSVAAYGGRNALNSISNVTIPVHGTPTTIAEFRKAVAEMKNDKAN